MNDSINIELVLDGNAWIACVGPNLQDGIGGSGPTPAEALKSLAANIEKEKAFSRRGSGVAG